MDDDTIDPTAPEPSALRFATPPEPEPSEPEPEPSASDAERLRALIARAPCPMYHTMGKRAPCKTAAGCTCWKSEA